MARRLWVMDSSWVLVAEALVAIVAAAEPVLEAADGYCPVEDLAGWVDQVEWGGQVQKCWEVVVISHRNYVVLIVGSLLVLRISRLGPGLSRYQRVRRVRWTMKLLR